MRLPDCLPEALALLPLEAGQLYAVALEALAKHMVQLRKAEAFALRDPAPLGAAGKACAAVRAVVAAMLADPRVHRRTGTVMRRGMRTALQPAGFEGVVSAARGEAAEGAGSVHADRAQLGTEGAGAALAPPAPARSVAGAHTPVVPAPSDKNRRIAEAKAAAIEDGLLLRAWRAAFTVYTR